MSISYPIGTPTPDGGLHLNEAERLWFAEVVRRIDTAYAEVALSTTMPPPPDYVQGYTARAISEVIGPFAEIFDVQQTEDDEYRGVQKKRAQITIIKGGVPPRPAF